MFIPFSFFFKLNLAHVCVCLSSCLAVGGKDSRDCVKSEFEKIYKKYDISSSVLQYIKCHCSIFCSVVKLSNAPYCLTSQNQIKPKVLLRAKIITNSFSCSTVITVAAIVVTVRSSVQTSHCCNTTPGVVSLPSHFFLVFVLFCYSVQRSISEC